MEEAKERLRQLFYLNVTDPERRSEFDLFNVSVSQKMWSAEQYHKQLAALNINDFKRRPYENGLQTEDSTTGEYQPRRSAVVRTTDTEFTGAIASHAQIINHPAYCRQLNCLLDGFFMNSTSVLDTLAHHISVLYTLDSVPDKLYIWNVSNMLSAGHRESKLRSVLDERLKENWFRELHDYRDCTTHETLIPYDMRLSLSPWSAEHEAPQITLSDAPKERPKPRYDQQREPVPYCEFILAKVRSLVEEVYENVLLDVQKANGILPIPKD